MRRLLLFIAFLLLLGKTQAQLSGTYVIGQGGSYPNLDSAVSVLLSAGVSGPVVFSILPGTYTGQITLTDIPGSSTTNTVVFESSTLNADDVTVSYSATNSSTNFVLFIKGGDNIVFNSITFKPTGFSYGANILLGHGCQNILFQNCKFAGSQNFSPANPWNFFNVSYQHANQQSISDSNIRFISNSFTDGYGGVFLNGISQTNPKLKDIYIIDNSLNINGFFLVIGNCVNLRVQKNEMNSSSLIPSDNSISYISGFLDISANKFSSLHPYTTFFSIANSSFPPSEPGLIYNNFITASPISNNTTFIKINYCHSIKLLHNSIHAYGGSYTNSSLIQIQSNCSNVNLTNNILSNQCGGVTLSTGNMTGILSSNYNDFYSTGPFLFWWMVSGYSSLAQWQTATSLDQNSLSVFPGFLNNTDLHISNPLLDSAGTPLVWVYDDIDGDLRDSLFPDIGADEFRILSKDLALSLFSGTTDKTCCRGVSESLSIGIVNLGTDTLHFATDNCYIHLFATGPNPMSFPTVMLTQGSLPPGDTLWKSITNSFNMQLSGSYQFWGYLSLTGDANAMNDTLYSAPMTVHNLYQFPYFQDFESLPYGLLLGEWRTIYSNQAFSWKVLNSNYSWFNPSYPYYPLYDHTLQTSSGHFAAAIADTTQTGVLLESPCIFVDSMQVKTLRFWYFMIGSNVGILHLDIDTGCGYIPSFWQLSGAQQLSQSDAWKLAVVDLSSLSGLVRLRFRSDNSMALPYATLLMCYIDDIQLGASLQNDAGVTEILSPGAVTLSGSSSLKVKIRNYGIAPLQQVQIAASVNSVNLPAVNWSGSLSSQSFSDTIHAGTLMLAKGPAQLKVWTQLPNNVQDSGTANDTCYHSMYVCDSYLKGYYTLGDSTSDFLTFGEAVDALRQCGIDSSVVILIKAGNYNEQVVIPTIPGTSSQNKVVFRAQSPISGTTGLFFSSSSAADNYVLKLSDASHIRFEGLSFTAQGQQYAGVVSINGVSAHNEFYRCSFNGSTAASGSPFRVLVLRESSTIENDSLNTFIENEFINGSLGILAQSNAGQYASNRWIIKGNRFAGQYFSAINASGYNALEIDSNSFHLSGSQKVISLSNCHDSVKITNNSMYHTNTQCGIFLNNHKSNVQTGVLIANNFLSLSGNQLQALSIDAPHARICFNNIHLSQQSTTQGSCLYLAHADTIMVLNNIFMGLGSVNLLDMSSLPGVMAQINHNCYWGGSGIARSGSQVYAGLASWQTASGKDTNSLNNNPHYFSSSDLHVTQPLLYHAGIAVVGITHDIDGQLRHPQTPCIGADEFIPYLGDMGVSKLVYPLDTTQSGASVLRFGLRNYGGDTLTSATVKWELNDTLRPDIAWTGFLLPGAEDTVSTATVSLPKYGTYRVKAWSHLPNNQSDPNLMNDTLTAEFYVCEGTLNGTYTIGQGPGNDFTGFIEAVEYMEKCGISGPVVFSVMPGIYQGQIRIRPIVGASAQNTIRFQSALQDSTQVQIIYEDSVQSPGICLHVMGAKHLSFERLSILINKAGISGRAIMMEDYSDSIRFVGCVVQSNAGGGNLSVNSVFEAGFVTGLQLEGNLVLGGMQSIFLRAGGRRNQIMNNYLSGMRANSIKAFGANQDSLVFHSNTVFNEPSGIDNTHSGLVQLSSLTGNGSITQNRIAGSLSVGLNQSAAGSSYLIANNFVHHYIPISTQSGWVSSFNLSYENPGYSPASVNANVLYNTVICYPVYYAPFNGNQSGMMINRLHSQVANNNIVNLRGGHALHLIDTLGIINTTHNNYHSSSGQIALINGQTLTSLAAINQMLPSDSQSVSLLPIFHSYTAPYVSGGGLDGKGLPQASVLTDIDGDIRDTLSPDIGADEFTPYGWDVMAISPLNPKSSHIFYQSSAALIMRFRNMSDSMISGLQVGYVSAQQGLVTEFWTGTLMPGDTSVHHFGVPLQLLPGQNYVKLFVKHPQDANAANDTLEWSLYAHQKVIPPWSDNFSSVVVNSYETEQPDRWECRLASPPFTSSPQSGAEAMIMKSLISGQTKDSRYYLYSPFFDISGLNNLRMGFYHNIQSLYGYRALEISTDTGKTWNTLGFKGDSLGVNWYNTLNNGKPCWSGKTSGWVFSDYLLSAYNNMVGIVQFRFVFWNVYMPFDNGRWAIDDFRIAFADSADAGISRILIPKQYLPASTVSHPSIVVRNYGTHALSNISLGYQVNNQSPVIESYPFVLASGDTAVYTFSTSFVSPGSFCLKAFSMVAGDANHTNDTNYLCLRRDVKLISFEYPPSQLPYDTSIFPRVWLTNKGEDTVYQFVMSLNYNSVPVANQGWAGVLNPGDTLSFTFSDSLSVLPGLRMLCAEINLPNDYYPADNQLCMSLTGTVNVDEYAVLTGFEYYPNPVSDMLMIRVLNDRPAFLKVYDVMGRQVFSTTLIDESTQLNLSHLPAGLYLGRIVSSSGEGGGFRFVKE